MPKHWVQLGPRSGAAAAGLWVQHRVECRRTVFGHPLANPSNPLTAVYRTTGIICQHDPDAGCRGLVGSRTRTPCCYCRLSCSRNNDIWELPLQAREGRGGSVLGSRADCSGGLRPALSPEAESTQVILPPRPALTPEVAAGHTGRRIAHAPDLARKLRHQQRPDPNPPLATPRPQVPAVHPPTRTGQPLSLAAADTAHPGLQPARQPRQRRLPVLSHLLANDKQAHPAPRAHPALIRTGQL
ncbi:hypothetical protein BT67DRAFT_59180 [Trichocladium antarcticum]|uniref:Uncharacterized protein n=1 Tax=Trichocladium antarcticum TaxID=1450529 RepID=A0AAN6UI61_9PEZI|nr:hypothetical protein BT67DRAFT_59180 [Trichocladium antarcticum]